MILKKVKIYNYRQLQKVELDLQNSLTVLAGPNNSGKTTLISSLIYSTILKHSAEEVNFYIMDFGSEMFRIFLDAPQVGDVLLVNDVEKVVNLFKMLNSII